MAEVAKVNNTPIDDIAKINNMDVPGGTLSEDTTGIALTTETGEFANLEVAANSDYDLATKTLTFAADSMAVAVGFCLGGTRIGGAECFKLRLYMDGTEVATSEFIPGFIAAYTVTCIVGTKALSGEKICKIALHNYTNDAGEFQLRHNLGAGDQLTAGIGIGSIKVT